MSGETLPELRFKLDYWHDQALHLRAALKDAERENERLREVRRLAEALLDEIERERDEMFAGVLYAAQALREALQEQGEGK